MPKATLKDWFLLTRPWSVTAPLVPFLVGLGLAYMDGEPEQGGILRWALALASGILLVLACNLFNTWGDERSGVDRMPGAVLTTPQIQEGKITLRQTFVFGVVLFALAGCVGLPTLVYQVDGAWRFNGFLFVGAAIGFLGAVNYSTGIKYKYLGLGVPMVAFLQGVLYVLVVMALLQPARWRRVWDYGSFGWFVLYWVFFSLPVAALVGVILHGNDMRDIATDRAAGIRSLAGWLRPLGALILFFLLHLLPYAIPGGLLACAWFLREDPWRAWPLALPFLVLPLTARLLVHAVRDYRANPSAPAWRDLEKGSGGVHFLFGVLYALALPLALGGE